MKDIEKEVAKENDEAKDSSDNYEFITETIKRKPVNVKKIVKKIVFTVILAIVFGLVASVTFIIVFPQIAMRLYPKDDTQQVTVPVAIEEDIVEEPVEEFVPPEEDEIVEETEVADNTPVDEASTEEAVTEGDNELKVNETASVEAGDNGEAESDESDVVAEEFDDVMTEEAVIVNQIVETIEKNLELDDYRSLLRKISSIAASAQKSLVTVSGRSSNTDWFNNSYENNNSSTGVIVADNGKEVLVISPTDILHAATNVDVTFHDGSTCKATIRLSDVNTGLSIVAVPKSNISEETLDKIEMAQFGSISTSAVGMPVVAVGSPYGTAGSVGMGQITSNSIVIGKTDANMRLISTDIYGSTNATGVIVNYNGRIVGIICHEDVVSDMPNLIKAYSISDIKDVIEKMSNNQKLPYLGIIGTDVTREANENYGVPFGTYVKEVIMDSPAMNVGIRNGDVIVQIEAKEIKSFVDYHNAILSCSPEDVVNITLQRPSGDDYTQVTYEVSLEELK